MTALSQWENSADIFLIQCNLLLTEDVYNNRKAKGGVQVDDKKLVSQLKKRNDKALSVLVERYSAYVSTVVRNIVREAMNESDVEEITADVFIRIWNDRDKLRSETLRSYLAVIARSVSVDRLRRLHYTVPIDELELDDSTDIETDTEKKILSEQFRTVIDEMAPRDKELLLRYYFYYQKLPEIAEEMEMKESACKTALHRARNKLKERLKERGVFNEEKYL